MDDSLQPGLVGRTACGGNLKDPQGFPSAFYGGERIYFCHQACLRVFEQSPNLFMAGEITHPKKDNYISQGCNRFMHRLWKVPEPVLYIGKKAYKKTRQTALCL